MINTSKNYFFHKNKQEIFIYYDKEIHAEKIFGSGCVVRSEHSTDILNAKSIGKEHLNVFIFEPFLFGNQ